MAGAGSRDRFTYAIGRVLERGRSVEVDLTLRKSPRREMHMRIVEAR
jgi:hypothetical protein